MSEGDLQDRLNRVAAQTVPDKYGCHSIEVHWFCWTHFPEGKWQMRIALEKVNNRRRWQQTMTLTLLEAVEWAEECLRSGDRSGPGG